MKNVLILIGSLALLPAAATAQQPVSTGKDTSALAIAGVEKARVKQMRSKNMAVWGLVRTAHMAYLRVAADSAQSTRRKKVN